MKCLERCLSREIFSFYSAFFHFSFCLIISHYLKFFPYSSPWMASELISLYFNNLGNLSQWMYRWEAPVVRNHKRNHANNDTKAAIYTNTAINHHFKRNVIPQLLLPFWHPSPLKYSLQSCVCALKVGWLSAVLFPVSDEESWKCRENLYAINRQYSLWTWQ